MVAEFLTVFVKADGGRVEYYTLSTVKDGEVEGIVKKSEDEMSESDWEKTTVYVIQEYIKDVLHDLIDFEGKEEEKKSGVGGEE